MAGHNGGFNPYRDQNGEFTEPSKAGQPGRKRGVGGAGGSGRRGAGRPSPAGMGRNGFTTRSNPTAMNFNIARSQGRPVADSVAYRQKGYGITGQNVAFERATRDLGKTK